MKRRDISRISGQLALLAAFMVALALIGGFFGRLHPALDSLAHFRAHLSVALVLLGLVLFFLHSSRRQGLLVAALGGAVIFNLMGLLPLPGLAAPQMPDGPKNGSAPLYRLLHLNLRYDNKEPGKVLSLLGKLRPDVVTFNEVSSMWGEKLELISSAYPYRVVCTVNNHAGGVAILSVRPFLEDAESGCIDGGTFATAFVDFGGRPVEIATLHLPWPWPFSQMHQIDKVAPLLAALAETSILAGDLNATPWSAASARVAEAAGMTPAGPSGPTWLHRKLPELLRFGGLPIDRVFAKGQLAVHSVRTLEAVGSDHLPLLAEFSLIEAEGDVPLTATASLSGRMSR